MASQSTAIQQLLRAEKKAAEKVKEARKRRAKRLQVAKDEAAEEIEKYRQRRDDALEELIKSGENTCCCLSKQERELQAKFDALEQLVAQNKERVIQGLLEYVYDIQLEVHTNLIKHSKRRKI